MTRNTANEAEVAGRLRIVFDGGLATNGTLLLGEYSASLAGWRQFFKVAGELYLRSFPEWRQLTGDALLRIEIETERAGSFEVDLSFVIGAAVGGVIGNRVDGLVVAGCKRLFNWYKKLAARHVAAKARSTNIDDLVAALEEMAASEGVDISPAEVPEEDVQLSLVAATGGGADSEESDEPEAEQEDRARMIVEALDQALELATRPLVGSSESVKVFEVGDQLLLSFGSAERSAIAEPLSLPPSSREWRPATIKFVRINRKTGKALFYYADDPLAENNAHYSRIVDPAVKRTGNVYTSAFHENRPLAVFLRHGKAEKGRLKLLWEITVNAPADEPLLPYI